MNFIEAVKKMQCGKRVRLTHWRNDTYAKRENSSYLISCNQGNIYHQFSEREILAEDWEIYEEQPKLYTFEEAFKLMKEGKTIKRQSSDIEFYFIKTFSRIIPSFK